MSIPRKHLGIAGLCLCLGVGAGSVPARADVLSGSLTGTTGGTETAQGTTWLTASFTTGTSAYRLDSVTLLLAASRSGTAEVDLYSDGGLEPGALLGTLSAPGSYAGTPTATTFTTSGMALTAATTYWIVLKANSGAFNWAWTTANIGTGAGFTNVWGQAADSGQTWFTDDVYTLQMAVNATAAGPGAVSGQLALEGVADLTAANSAASVGGLQILYRTPGTATVLYTASAALAPVGAGSAFGTFTASGTVPAGTYDITLKTAKNLQVVQTNVLVYGATRLPGVTLAAGDANNDNKVDIGDFGVLVNAYGGDAGFTGSGYDARANFNYDGVVDIADFGLLVNNYGSQGSP